jgi:hypothetical protein
MAKPAVTLRGTKGTPLTNDELDTNFENLRDATITLQADTSGTNVVAELNGTITLVAGTNVTITGDDSTKEITIDAATGANSALQSNTIALGDEDVAAVTLQPPSGYTSKDLILGFDTIEIDSPSGTNIIQGNGTDLLLALTGSDTLIQFDNANIEIETDSGTGQIYLAASELDLRFTSHGSQECRLALGNFTTTERDAFTGLQAGTIIFNETTSKFQGYDGTTWNDLH